MDAATLMLLAGTVSMPFAGESARQAYVEELCRDAVRQVKSGPDAARDAFRVCLYAFRDMQYAGKPLHECAEVVDEFRPLHRAEAKAVCEIARRSTIDWSGGRF